MKPTDNNPFAPTATPAGNTSPSSGSSPSSAVAPSSNESEVSRTPESQVQAPTIAQARSQDDAQSSFRGAAPRAAPAVTHLETPNVLQPLQAAQLEHNSSTDGVSNPSGSNDCALAGGDSPQTPLQNSKTKSAKKSRSKKRDNHVSIRLTDEEWDVIERYMAMTGMTLSEAIRAIISHFENKARSIHLHPKAPPAHLEKLIGELAKWRKEFSKAKPRLNIPTPANDAERHAQVTKWRSESDRLLKEIPKLEELLRLALGVMTSLTAERVIHINNGYTTLGGWQNKFESDKKENLAAFLQALMDLLKDAGIKPIDKK